VKRPVKIEETAFACGILIDGLVPKGGIDSGDSSNSFSAKGFLATG
jgi:hypothetical protein